MNRIQRTLSLVALAGGMIFSSASIYAQDQKGGIDNAMLERRNLENKILGGIVKLWGMENFFDAEMSKLDSIKDEEVRFTKEMTLRSKAEYIEILAKKLFNL